MCLVLASIFLGIALMVVRTAARTGYRIKGGEDAETTGTRVAEKEYRLRSPK
jgi:hypothetical protein